jgi:hypothetical protein
MNPDIPVHIQSVIESVCELGCERVNEIIISLESGQRVSEISGLDDSEQRCVLAELKAIMSVYEADQH